MFGIKYTPFVKIGLVTLILLAAINCAKDLNTFLPYVRIDLHISLVNYNHLKIPGNSIVFKNEGFRGLIVVCTNPDLNQYFAYDACCPYEKDYSGTVEVKPIRNLASPPGMVFSSDFLGICNKCGSEFNLMSGGQPTKGPASRYLQSYSINTGFESLLISN